MPTKPKPEILPISPRGVVQLPEWAWKRLLKMSGVRAKSRRKQRKAIKKEFLKALRASLGIKKLP